MYKGLVFWALILSSLVVVVISFNSIISVICYLILLSIFLVKGKNLIHNIFKLKINIFSRVYIEVQNKIKRFKDNIISNIIRLKKVTLDIYIKYKIGKIGKNLCLLFGFYIIFIVIFNYTADVKIKRGIDIKIPIQATIDDTLDYGLNMVKFKINKDTFIYENDIDIVDVDSEEDMILFNYDILYEGNIYNPSVRLNIFELHALRISKTYFKVPIIKEYPVERFSVENPDILKVRVPLWAKTEANFNIETEEVTVYPMYAIKEETSNIPLLIILFFNMIGVDLKLIKYWYVIIFYYIWKTILIQELEKIKSSKLRK